MIQMPGWIAQLTKKSGSDNQVFIDVGSSQTRVYVGSTLLFYEPTCIAVHKQSGTVVVIGKKAQALLGKAGKHLQIIFPIQAGVIASRPAFEFFLQAVLKQIGLAQPIFRRIMGPTGYLGIPAGISPVETSWFRNSLNKIGLARVKLFPQVESIYQQLVANPSLAQSYCFLDVGAQKTQIAMFSAGELIRAESIRWGGVQLTEAVQTIVRSAHECTIGWHEAEKIKLQVGQLQSDTVKLIRAKVAVRGKDVVSQVSKTVVVDSTLFAQEFAHLVEELHDNLENFFSQIPSDVVTSALEHGIYLTGGMSALPNLGVVLAERLQAATMISKDPFFDVVKGMMKRHE